MARGVRALRCVVVAGSLVSLAGCAGAEGRSGVPGRPTAPTSGTPPVAASVPPDWTAWSRPPAQRADEPPAVAAPVRALEPDWHQPAVHRLTLPGALPYVGAAAVAPPTDRPPPLPAGAVARIGGPPDVPQPWRIGPRAERFVARPKSGGLVLYDARSRQRIAPIPTKLTDDEVRRASLTFSADGGTLALFVAQARPSQIELFSTSDGRRTSVVALPDGVRSLFFDPTGQRAVLLFEEQSGHPVRVAVAELPAGQVSQIPLPLEPAADRIAALSPDGRLLLTVTAGATDAAAEPAARPPADRATMVELPAGRLLWTAPCPVGSLTGDTPPRFSPDGRWIAVSGGITQVRHARTGELAYERYERLAAFAPDGRALLETMGGLTERDFDGAPRMRFESPENDAARHTVVTASGWVVMSTTLNQETYWWERATGRPLLRPTARLHGVQLTFSHDGRELIGYDGEYLFRWSARDGRPLDRRERYDSLVASESGQRLLAAGGAKALERVEAMAVQATRLAENRSLRLSRDGSRLMVTTIGGSATDVIIDLSSGRVRPLGAQGGAVELSPDGELIAHCGPPLRLLRSDTGELVREIALGDEVALCSAAFRPDGQELAVMLGPPTSVRLIPTSGRRPSRRVFTQGEVTSLGYSPSGGELAIGYQDGRVDVRTVDRDRQLHSFWGHRETVYDLAFAPDGTGLATASTDGTALVWKLR